MMVRHLKRQNFPSGEIWYGLVATSKGLRRWVFFLCRLLGFSSRKWDSIYGFQYGWYIWQKWYPNMIQNNPYMLLTNRKWMIYIWPFFAEYMNGMIYGIIFLTYGSKKWDDIWINIYGSIFWECLKKWRCPALAGWWRKNWKHPKRLNGWLGG